MSSKHSPEPWGISPIGDQNVEIVSLAGGKREPLGILCKFDLPEEMDNTTRLVDCVNACRDLKDPILVPKLFAMLRRLATISTMDLDWDAELQDLLARAEGRSDAHL